MWSATLILSALQLVELPGSFIGAAIGVVSFANFGPLRLSSFINKQACDVLMGIQPAQSIEQRVQQYEKRIDEARQRIEAVRRVANTTPSHPLRDYVGIYMHTAYGKLEIRCRDEALVLHRNRLVLPLEHWHYDAWVSKESEIFPIYAPHAFDAAGRLVFEMNADGDIVAVSIRLEPAVEPIRFQKQSPRCGTPLHINHPIQAQLCGS